MHVERFQLSSIRWSIYKTLLLEWTIIFGLNSIQIEMIQNDKSFCINLIDLGTFQSLFWIIFTLYGRMTPCDVSFLKIGHLDWFSGGLKGYQSDSSIFELPLVSIHSNQTMK